VIDRFPFDHAELVIIDTAHFTEGPIGTIFVPLFLRPAFHGAWVSD